MVQPEIPGDEAVNNIIDQASAEIDRELATTAESQAQPLTADQVQQIVQSQMQPFQNQISGLQSLYDRGLNAIRRDSEEKLQQIQRETQMQQSQARRDQYLGTLDGRERELVEPLMQEMDNMKQVYLQSLASQQSAQVPEQAPAANPQDQWEAVYKVVENMGVNRNDANVNYQVLMDTTKTDAQKQEVFFASVRNAVTQQGQQQVPQATAQPQPADPQAQTPPVENSRQGGSGVHQSIDELCDWYIGLNRPTQEQEAYYRQKFEQLT